MLNSYSHIYQLGHREVVDIFNHYVIIEEKVDGSQFSFGVTEDGEIMCRSRGKDQYPNTDKMFELAVEVVQRLAHILTPGWVYRGEYLSKPKHNTLAYDRVPTGHIVIFDIDTGDQCYLSQFKKCAEAHRIGLETVPFKFGGDDFGGDMTRMLKMLEDESFLGGQKIEGLVIKAYDHYDRSGKVLMCKYVSEAFKEIHVKDWKLRNKGNKDVIESIVVGLRTTARWEKGLQHLKERGELKDEVCDIGPLIKEIQADVLEECEGQIKDLLYQWAIRNIERGVVRGCAEWYKAKLAEKCFTEAD